MTIHLASFGTMLISRPAGREAYLAAQAYSLPKNTDEMIDIDFTGVKVVAPSWLDEFITPLRQTFGEKLRLGHSDNPSVTASLATIYEKF